MTIASEVAKLQTNLENSYTKVNTKGGTLPQNQCFDNLPDAIDSIVTGGDVTSLSITPSTSSQSFSKQGQYDGYNPVTVSAVTSAIDPNLQARFIRNGIEILGIEGTFGDPYYEPQLLTVPSGCFNHSHGYGSYITNTGAVYTDGTYIQDPLVGQKGIQIVSSENDSRAYLTSDKDLYIYGSGYGSSTSDVLNTGGNFKKVDNKASYIVMDLKNLWYIKDDDHKLYGAGINHRGQLGTGSTSTSNTSSSGYVSFYNQLNYAVKQIAVAPGVILALTEGNALYRCGANTGNPSSTTANYTSFTYVASNVKDIACSVKTAWYVTNSGDLYGQGWNRYGQQGNGTTTDVSTFTKIAEGVKTVRCSSSMTWYINENDELFGCGQGNTGAQGNGGSSWSSNVSVFTKRAENVDRVFPSSMAGVYTYDSYDYYCVTWFITKDNELFGCGYNDYGQQGSGNTTNVTTFTKRAENVVQFISDQGSKSYYLNKFGEVYYCGYGIGSTFTKLRDI